jgi:hypothetical protein
MSEPPVAALDDAQLRERLSALVGEYSRRVQRAQEDRASIPEPLDRDAVTPTDVLLAARQMLDVFDIAAFELGMLG